MSRVTQLRACNNTTSANDNKLTDTNPNKWRMALVALASLAMVACGHDDDDDDKSTSGGAGSGGSTTSSSGGGSTGSSSGSSSGSTTPTTANSPFAGTYRGTVKLTAESKTVGSTSDSFPMTATVSKGAVMNFRSEQVRFSTSVDKNGWFRKTIEFDQEKNNTRCRGTLKVAGRITEASGVMDGNVNGPLTCRRGALKVNGTATGSFNARR